jgi:hypothetical protein
MRAALAIAALAGCGRLDFDPIASAHGTALSIDAVAPSWVMASGGPIDVTLSGDLTGVAIAIDGVPCETPTMTDATTLHCNAPAHAPASVGITSGDATYAGLFAYVTPGMYQLGGTLDDRTSGVAVDRDGNVFVTGGTTGSLGAANLGDFDSVLIKYDVSGTVAWVRQLGTPLYDYSRDVAVDPQGNATIAGYTAGNMTGPNSGINDIFVARYAPDGTLLWVAQVGGPGDDQAWDLAVDDAGNTVIAVQTTGALPGQTSAGGQDYAIVRYKPDGSLDWIRQVGTAADDFGHSVTVTPDGISYLVGYTTGALVGTNAGGLDLFVARYEIDGTRTWIRQRGGAGDDAAQDAMYDPNDSGVWVVGYTTATLDGTTSGGGQDVFLSKFAADGTWQLTRQLGGAGTENSWGVGIATDGTVYVECVTTAAFDGQSYAGGPEDFCMAAYDKTGAHLWTRIAGTAGTDESSSCFVDRARTGLVYMSLITDNSLDGMPNRGGNDIGVVKLDETGAIR